MSLTTSFACPRRDTDATVLWESEQYRIVRKERDHPLSTAVLEMERSDGRDALGRWRWEPVLRNTRMDEMEALLSLLVRVVGHQAYTIQELHEKCKQLATTTQ